MNKRHLNDFAKIQILSYKVDEYTNRFSISYKHIRKMLLSTRKIPLFDFVEKYLN